LAPSRLFSILGARRYQRLAQTGTEVAAFEFASIERSYAALTAGQPLAVGLAAFESDCPPLPLQLRPSPPA
jgi:hypothetical protein